MKLKVHGIGRLAKDVDARATSTGTSLARYTIACDRGKSKDGKDLGADFINCVCYGATADFAEKFLKKGMKIYIEGYIQTGSYTNREGQKVYTTDVVVTNHEFCESKNSGMSQINTTIETEPDSFMDIPDGFDEELPFE